MQAKSANIEVIFYQALKQQPLSEQAAYLDRACGDDAEFRTEVESLLAAHAQAAGLFECPAVSEVLDEEVAQPTEGPGTLIGRYQLLELIGEGGFGNVYLAEQREPVQRTVALKIIKLGMDTKQVIARFEAEEQALALMDHPNIAKVLDAGATESGRPYFVMELVHGTPLTEYCDQNALTINQRLELFVSICQAVQHAHQKGIIHRDIKPSNVMVTLHDRVPVPKVIDFGIAKATDRHLTERTVFTSYGQMVGTPLYMSPEQAEMRGLDIDTRSDIYSLGVLLYELLTGTTPFECEKLSEVPYDEMRRIIREEEPLKPSMRISTLGGSLTTVAEKRHTDPRKVVQQVSGELDWIVMMALEKDRTQRYPTANSLARDVQRALNDEPVQACPPSAAYRFRKFVRRNRTKVVAVAAAVLTLVGVFATIMVLFAIAFRRETTLRQEAQQAQQRAEWSELEARRMAYASDIKLASQAHREGDLQHFVDLLDQQFPSERELDLRGFEWYYLRQLASVSHSGLTGHQGAVYSTCCSPDGRLLATAGEDAMVRIYDLDTHQVRTTVEAGQGEVNGVAFAPDGQTIASAGDDGTVKLWDVDTGRQVRKLEAHPGEAYNVLYTPDGKRLISCGNDPMIRLWDPRTGELQGELDAHARGVEAITLAPNGRVLGSAGSDHAARLWDLDSLDGIRTLWGHRSPLSSITFSPDGKWVATGSKDKTVRIWDATTGALVSMVRHLDGVQCLAFSQDGRWLAAGDRGGMIRLWPRTWTLPDWSFGSEGQVQWCGIAPDGRTVAAATREHFLFRDLQTREICELKVADPSILGTAADSDHDQVFAFSRTGRMLACVTEIHCADLSTPTGWRLKTRLDEDGRNLVSFAFSPDDRTLAVGQTDGTVSLWDTETGKRRIKLEGHHEGGVVAVAYSPDGQRLASAGANHVVAVWDAKGSKEDAFPGWVNCIAFSPDGMLLASGGADRCIRLRNLETRQEVGLFIAHAEPANSVAFSPDGTRLASACYHDHTVRIWDVQSLKLLRTYSANATFVRFLPDGKSVMSGGRGDSIRFWHLEGDDVPQSGAGKTLKWHEGRVYSVAGLRHGGEWVSSGQDGKVIVSSASSSSTESEVDHLAFDFAFTADGRALAIASPDRIHLVNVATGSEAATLPGDEADWQSVAAALDGGLLAAGNRRGMISLWDVRTRSRRICWNVGNFDIRERQLALSPDGSRLAAMVSGENIEEAQLFDAATGELVHAFPAENCHTAAFSPEGNRLVVDSKNDLLVWDIASRRLLHTLRGHTYGINAIVFSPDGRLIASAGNDRNVRLWDADVGLLRFTLTGHRGDVESVAFSPDGCSLATADGSGCVKMWHIPTGRELLELVHQRWPIQKISFSPDGKHLAYLVPENRVVRIIHVSDFEAHRGNRSVTAKP